MKARVALVTPSYGNQWREEDVMCRRMAGALATSAEVTVLVACGESHSEMNDGAARVVRLPAFPVRPLRREAVLRSVFGPEEEMLSLACGCIRRTAFDMVEDLAQRAQEEIVRTRGGDSPALWRHLAENAYDVVVFADFASASTVFGLRAVPSGTRVVLLPFAHDPLLLRMPIVQEGVERASCMTVTSEAERQLVERWVDGRVPVWNTAFVLRVNEVVRAAPPHGLVEGEHTVVVAADWTAPVDSSWVGRLARTISAELGDRVRLRAIGPGASAVLHQGGEHLSGSRLDVWRWMNWATALLDPTPHRLLGREALEALMLGTPIVVLADGGAAREHAELGDGGLWYRTETELLACLQALLDQRTKEALGAQGRTYALDRYADTDQYIRTVVKTVLEDA